MIVNIRGTSGSGKSTLARRVMAEYTNGQSRIQRPGRKHPFGYILHHHHTAKALVIIGHYESPCGGCDTIKTYAEVFQAVQDSHDAGHNVLFEGLLLSTDKIHITELALAYPDDHLIIGLDVPLVECLRCVNERRRAKNPDKEDVNPKGTNSKHGTNKRAMKHFTDNGLNAEWHNRESAFQRIKEALGI
ncbi:hypothetical protein LCGC14_0599620 [marine sediment metagenome]|uniref:Uncharacterized protein n=1 Tax=marine sediment metagenome TaxID=412755 RepID=A0A0F9RUU1_9ZZZZ